MRLIDADEYVSQLSAYAASTDKENVKAVYERFIQYVSQCPTAYDVEDVVTQLKEKMPSRVGNQYEVMAENILLDAIDIVQNEKVIEEERDI